MNAFFTFVVSMTLFTATSMAQNLPAGSTVRFVLNMNQGLCLGVVSTNENAQILLQPCGSPGTTFTLDNGISSIATRLELVYSGAEPLCVDAANSQAGNTPVLLDMCADAPFERWHVAGGTGTGQLISAAANEAFCLTALANGQGDPVVYQSCTGTSNQQWNTIALDDA